MYRIDEIGKSSGWADIWPTAINNLGHVVGRGGSPSGQGRAFRWRPSGMVELPPLAGENSCEATGINDSNTVCGNSGSRACSWSANTVQELGPGLERANAINNAGHIVGTSGGRPTPWLFANGQATDLDIGAGLFSPVHAGAAMGINNFDRTVGTLSSLGGDIPVMWDPSAGVVGLKPWTTPSFEAISMAVNDAGLIVGYARTSGSNRAIVWENLDGRILPTLNAGADANEIAFDVNAGGEIVGLSGGVAARWTGDAVEDLNTRLAPGTGWVLTAAFANNDRGQIVGLGGLNGRRAAWVLSPKLDVLDWRRLPAYVVHIVYGVVLGQAGVIINAKGEVVPVPPVNPAWTMLSPRERSELASIAMTQLAKDAAGKQPGEASFQSTYKALAEKIAEMRRARRGE